ncbi:GlxA family transcriptional regulator [Thioalkalivibrio sp. XN279]|uniref:GlxA family transcriptional regulator n=1 Tax=Thioalkalivibrio sp. XN279 TaxID=2714953 RepID=UPI0014077698|nr:DJ-1/PfpI family protein [Thioalkalivibrio sp. XN279]NHA14345.1 helix-turn-helix domain-containing protein [Thioalkalivibrio sp. XN279]
MQDSSEGTTRQVAMVGFDGFQLLDVTGPLEVFSSASRLLRAQGYRGPEPYRVELLAAAPGLVRSSSGLGIHAARSWRDLDAVDTLLVAGGGGIAEALDDAELVQWIRVQAPRARRYGSVCTGALLLARAGLLEGRRATTHWAAVDELERLEPALRLVRDVVFVRDGRLWTSAGVTAGMDMALAMVGEDWGRKLALEVAQQLVMYISRAGGSAQRGPPLEVQVRALESRFAHLATRVQEQPGAKLSVDTLASWCGMSPRHFARCFRKEMGVTPAQFVEGVRFEAACQALGSTAAPVSKIAALCGFGSSETLRRVFMRRLGVTPGIYRRQRLGADATAA